MRQLCQAGLVYTNADEDPYCRTLHVYITNYDHSAYHFDKLLKPMSQIIDSSHEFNN